jgi:hypothetical protein
VSVFECIVPRRNLAAHDAAGVSAVWRKAHAPVEQIQGAIGAKPNAGFADPALSA